MALQNRLEGNTVQQVKATYTISEIKLLLLKIPAQQQYQRYNNY